MSWADAAIQMRRERDEALARAEKAEAERDEARRLLAAAVDLSEQDRRERDEARCLAGRVRTAALALRSADTDTYDVWRERAAKRDAAVDAVPVEWEVTP